MIPGGFGSRMRTVILPKVFFILLFLPGICVSAEGTTAISRAERAKLAQKVKEIFGKKCAKCHTSDGSEREKYKDEADIDIILNLEKLASHTDIIVRGDPKGSGLYLQVEDGSMPYSDLGGDPLPIMEKRAIAQWIEAGAPNEKGKIGSAVR